MTTKILAGLALALGALSASAGEHPEHPTGAAAPARVQEHPEHPPARQVAPAEDPQARLKKIRDEYEAKVREVGKAGGKTESFKIHDDKLGKDWRLRVARVHKDKIVQLGGNTYFACSDFKSVQKGAKDTLDLDFLATKNADGSWTIDKALIHKVNGVPRYQWNEKNEMVPVK